MDDGNGHQLNVNDDDFENGIDETHNGDYSRDPSLGADDPNNYSNEDDDGNDEFDIIITQPPANSDYEEDDDNEGDQSGATETLQGGGDEEEEDEIANGDADARYNETLKEMDKLGLVDIGRLASWKLSSYKPGFGIEELQNDDPSLFWQSDGQQPHYIDLHFSKRVSVERISIYVDHNLDESYTPEKIVVSAGTGFHDLQDISTSEIKEHVGWYHIELNNSRDDGITKAFLIRLSILSNHQSGKDTHIRALKVFSPLDRRSLLDNEEIPFTTIRMLSETTLR